MRSEPQGAGYFFLSTKEGYPLPQFLQQGMTVKVKAIPRGCYELDRIEVKSGRELRTYRDVDEILITLEDYSTEVVAVFRGYPEEKCPYFTVPLGDRAVKVDRSLAYLLLIPPIASAGVLAIKGVRARSRGFPRELRSLGFLAGRLNSRDLLDLVVFLNACRSVMEGDPILLLSGSARRSGPAMRYEDLLTATNPISCEVVGLGRLARTYPWVIDYAYSKGLVPPSRKKAEEAVRKVLRLIREGRYEEVPGVIR
ncbi:MAG: hypothetical protein RRA34_04930 [Candidatus Calditenuis sp.]|nr:hypothetical protein [Candidatus Calditenuis sp.]